MAAADITLPGVPPVDQNGLSAEYLRQLAVTLQQVKNEIAALESQISIRRLQ